MNPGWLRSWRDVRLKRRKVRWSNGGRGDFCEVGNLVAKLKILTNIKMLTAVNLVYFLSLIVHVIFAEFDITHSCLLQSIGFDQFDDEF